MQVSASDWERYIGRLQAVNRAAAEVMQGWMNENPGGDVEDMIAVAYAASTYYGDAAATLACEMYDALAEAQGAELPPAEPAETATYSETAKAVRGTMKNQRNSVPDTVGRLVKLAGADTMLQNARRDGAEWAWVPFGGETCAFCITLASRGWQRQGKKAAEGDHAEHIHPHCQCEYVVRFDGSSTVEGYDPDKYLEMYENAEGRTPNEKMRSLRRELYAENKDRINEQKRVAYAARRERENAKELIPSESGGPDFYVGENGKVLSAKYSEWIGDNQMQTLLNEAISEEAKRYIRSDYRRTSFIGNGSTAAILKFEKETGLNCAREGRNHQKKAEDLVRQLQKILLHNLPESDRIMLQKELSDLEKVIGYADG